MIPKRKRAPKHAGLPFALPVKKRGEDKKKMYFTNPRRIL
jgi:hypothetical protein